MLDFDHTTKEGRAQFYGSSEWREKRAEILARDNYECQWCKEAGRVTVEGNAVLEVDHIQELAEHPELAFDNDNLRTLCKDCHNRRHGRMNYRGQGVRAARWADERWD